MEKNIINMSDEELINIYKAGDKEAFNILVKKYSTIVSVYLHKNLKDPMLAEDIKQDTFIRAMNALEKNTYQETGNFKSWLLQIGRNIMLDYFRRNKKLLLNISIPYQTDENEYLIEIQDLDENPEEQITELEFNSEIELLVNELITQIPDEQKEVVFLRFYCGMSFKEISEQTGLSINTCLGRMRYALYNLRKKIRFVDPERYER